ncbi:MAG: HAMP domain-containing protein [Patescibacteria group bacterium]
MTVLQQFNILLAGVSVLISFVSLILLYRGGHRFYPSRVKPYNLLKFGFFCYLLGHVYSLFIVFYAETHEFTKLKTYYLVAGGVGLMILGLILLFIGQKRLATGQQNQDITRALKRICLGQYFLTLPLLSIVLNLTMDASVLVWTVTAIVGFFLIILGTYQLREVRIAALAEIIIFVNFIVFLLFLISLGYYLSGNLQERFVRIEINSLTDFTESQIGDHLTKEVFANYEENSNQVVLKGFADEFITETIQSAVVWDMEGRTVYSNHSDLIGLSALNIDADYIEAKKGGIVYKVFDEEKENIYRGISDYQLKLYYPIKIGEAQTQVGVVGIFSNSPVAEESAWMSRVVIWTLVITFLAFFIIMVIIDFVVLRNVVIRPLREISERARNIVENNDYREHTVVGYESQDEIGQIAKAINKLSFRLSQHEKKNKENHHE